MTVDPYVTPSFEKRSVIGVHASAKFSFRLTFADAVYPTSETVVAATVNPPLGAPVSPGQPPGVVVLEVVVVELLGVLVVVDDGAVVVVVDDAPPTVMPSGVNNDDMRTIWFTPLAAGARNCATTVTRR